MNILTENKELLIPIITLILGWLGKCLKNKIPASWAKFVTALAPETLDELVLAASTKIGRAGYVRERITEVAESHGIELSDAETTIIMNQLTRCWKAGIKFASSKK